MTPSRRIAFAGFVALGAVACTSILGTFEVGPATTPGTDSGSDGNVGTTDGGDAGVDASVPGLDNAVEVTAGVRHTCALVADNVYCWGDNSSGQLGSPPSGLARSPVPLPIPGLPKIAHVRAGGFHTCAIEKVQSQTAGAKVWCWGKNDCGQLGNGGTTNPSPVPSALAQVGGADIGAVSLGAGTAHTCAVDSGGTVYCWGCNNASQVSNGNGASFAIAQTTIPANYKGQSVSAGGRDTCAVLGAIDGAGSRVGVGCLGTEDNGSLGSLGDGPPAQSIHPTLVEAQLGDAGANGATAVVAGEGHTCAIDGDQHLYCWGQNDFGQVGVVPNPVPAPVRAEPTRLVAEVAVGGTFTCFNTAVEKHVFCFGANNAGQLGRNTADTQVHPQADGVVTPFPMMVTSVAAGRDHACMVSAGHVFCWGSNSDGQIGDGTTGTNRQAPVPVQPAKP